MTCRKGHWLYDAPRAKGEPPRWTAVIHYRTDAGPVDVEHQFEEMDMLHDIVERGPCWSTIDRIEVRLTRVHDETIEGALAR